MPFSRRDCRSRGLRHRGVRRCRGHGRSCRHRPCGRAGSGSRDWGHSRRRARRSGGNSCLSSAIIRGVVNMRSAGLHGSSVSSCAVGRPAAHVGCGVGIARCASASRWACQACWGIYCRQKRTIATVHAASWSPTHAAIHAAPRLHGTGSR